MSQSFLSLNFLPKGRFRVDLVEGVTKTNFFTICYGALTTIGLLTFISYATTYVLIENLDYQRNQIGTIVGDLQVVAEIALLIIFLPVGLIADKIGRRQVYSFGMFAMGLSYFLYPLASLENKEIFSYLLILDCKPLFLVLQNDLANLEYDNDLQFLSMNLNLDEPMVNDNFHNNFQLQISNYILLLN